LFGRNLLLIVGLIVSSQLVSAMLFNVFIQQPRVARLAVVTAAHVEATYALLVNGTQDQREAFAQRMRNSGVIMVVRQNEPPALFDNKPTWLARGFMKHLSAELSTKHGVFWQSAPKPQLWIRVDLPDENYWLGFSVERLVEDVSYGFVIISLICAALALLGAYLIQRRVNLPLTQLAQAAQRVGKGELAQRLPVDGPSEIAAVSASFNQMSASLAQLENDRAIMLAGVSHDLRTPLAKMRLAIELLRAKPDAQLLADLERHIEHIDAIIGQFLAYARFGNDEALQLIALEPVLHELVSDAARHGQVFEARIDALPMLALRPVAIRRVFTNLMENAQRYGCAPFAIEAQQHANAVVVRVIDSGGGITPGSEEEIKKPFVRLDGSRGGSAAGASGLGLAIAERVVRLHGGTLTLSNRAGGGFEACVELPL
jgi:two-component system osmolarity sensor histidine kinase EnvZ